MFMTITDLLKLLSKCASLYGSGLERRKETCTCSNNRAWQLPKYNKKGKCGSEWDVTLFNPGRPVRSKIVPSWGIFLGKEPCSPSLCFVNHKRVDSESPPANLRAAAPSHHHLIAHIVRYGAGDAVGD
jgi:hypothetical protein